MIIVSQFSELGWYFRCNYTVGGMGRELKPEYKDSGIIIYKGQCVKRLDTMEERYILEAFEVPDELYFQAAMGFHPTISKEETHTHVS